jgi:hypothetical protein
MHGVKGWGRKILENPLHFHKLYVTIFDRVAPCGVKSKRKGRAAGKNSRRPADGGGQGACPAPCLAAVAFPAIYIISECLWKGGEAMWTIEMLFQGASLLVALAELFLYLWDRKRK